MPALLPDLDDVPVVRPAGPLAVRITYVRPIPLAASVAAARGGRVCLRDHVRRPEVVRHYVPVPGGGRDEALALLGRLVSSEAVRSGRWRVAIVPAGAGAPA